jgi:hypothetical protein
MYRGFAILAAVTSLATAAQSQLSQSPTLYRLDPATSFEEGCQPPCQCPIITTSDVFGTFTLRFTNSDPAGFNHYAVERVNWEVDMPGSVRRVTGSGQYKVGGQFAISQQLQLDLSFDGAAAVHFDSGVVAGGGGFPAIVIDIARNGFYCWDQVFRLQASPVAATSLVPYHLENSQYLVGCLPPCLCLLQTFTAVGTFNLLDLGPSTTSTIQHYALVDIHWQTLPSPAPPDQNFTGFGIYRLDAGTGKQRLVCDLTDGNALTQRFDSGTVAGGDNAPGKIDIDIATNGFYCFDHVFKLHARL